MTGMMQDGYDGSGCFHCRCGNSRGGEPVKLSELVAIVVVVVMISSDKI